MNTITILDEMIADYFKSYENAQEEFVRIAFGNRIKSLTEARDKISSLPSLDIDSLQRYKSTPDDFCTMQAYGEGEWIKYDDLKKLLQDTLELNQ